MKLTQPKTMRSNLCEQFLKYQGVNCVSIIADDDEGYFRMRGCDCCKTGLGNTVFDCNGYDPKSKEVVEVGSICGECICFFYNGDDSEVES